MDDDTKARRKAYYRAWYLANRDAVRAKQAKRYAEDPEWRAKFLEQCKAGRDARKDTPEYKAVKKAWRDANKAKVQASRDAWRERNIEAVRADNRARIARIQADDPQRLRDASVRWRQNHPDEARAAKQRRRAVELAAPFIERVYSKVVFERDNYRCQLCGGQTIIDGPIRDRPTVDHIIPLSQGGAHCYDNAQTAHHGCNSSKGDRIPR